MARSNLAYDYEQMRQAYSPAQTDVSQPPELHVVSSRETKHRAVYMRYALVFLILITFFSAVIYKRTVLTELTAQVESQRNSYDSLVAENRRMQVELEGKTSLRTIEEAAEALGMSKAESYQIEYVDIGEGENVTLSQEEPGTIQKIAAQARDTFDGLMSYLGL